MWRSLLLFFTQHHIIMPLTGKHDILFCHLPHRSPTSQWPSIICLAITLSRYSECTNAEMRDLSCFFFMGEDSQLCLGRFFPYVFIAVLLSDWLLFLSQVFIFMSSSRTLCGITFVIITPLLFNCLPYLAGINIFHSPSMCIKMVSWISNYLLVLLFFLYQSQF